MTNNEIIFGALAEQGITKVVIPFSGGNDEGSADGATAHYADGTEKDLSAQAYFDYGTQTHVVYECDGTEPKKRPATPEEVAHAELMEKLEQPIYDRWGGFAGDFHVNGTLTWDVTARSVTLDGDESTQQYDPFSYEL